MKPEQLQEKIRVLGYDPTKPETEEDGILDEARRRWWMRRRFWGIQEEFPSALIARARVSSFVMQPYLTLPISDSSSVSASMRQHKFDLNNTCLCLRS